MKQLDWLQFENLRGQNLRICMVFGPLADQFKMMMRVWAPGCAWAITRIETYSQRIKKSTLRFSKSRFSCEKHDFQLRICKFSNLRICKTRKILEKHVCGPHRCIRTTLRSHLGDSDTGARSSARSIVSYGHANCQMRKFSKFENLQFENLLIWEFEKISKIRLYYDLNPMSGNGFQ